MPISPNAIASSDTAWMQACALMQVLPLDIRTGHGRRSRSPAAGLIENADSFLTRPTITVNRKQVLAPYYQYMLQFKVAECVFGTIDVDSQDELTEFRRVVNDALSGPLTSAERRRLAALHARAQLPSRMWGESTPEIERLCEIEAAEEAAALINYTSVMLQTGATVPVRQPRDRFAEAMSALVALGMTKLCHDPQDALASKSDAFTC